ncbi:Serine hydroxymethyltransferase [Operophtera brumata]|uniref:Serine hydroxymethyltransferase n=1 Tax=Operophtera brumata TaxID=104452 RepID=A0A0L7KZW1_OPEBR|nr:Serine hydroxymethyltransferase [Operophtera brumata]
MLGNKQTCGPLQRKSGTDRYECPDAFLRDEDGLPVCLSSSSVRNYHRTATMSSQIMNGNLWDTDPELFDLITKEKSRQRAGLEMIASENFTSIPVLQCLSTCLHNKYSEGMPNQRLVSDLFSYVTNFI